LAFDYSGTEGSSHAPAGFNCTSTSYVPVGGNGNGTVGVAVSANGTIFTLPNCTDGTSTYTYILGYPAAAKGLSVPTIFDPINEAELGGWNLNGGQALAYSAKDVVYAETNNSTASIVGFPATSNNKPPTLVTGQNCYQEPFISPCSSGGGTGGFTTGFGQGFSVDSNGYAYVPGAWTDEPGPQASPLDFMQNPPAIVDVSISSSSASFITTPHTVVGGFYALLGGTDVPPLATAIDGSTLYVLVPGNPLNDEQGNTYAPGLSACPSPSSNAPLNAIISNNQSQTNCTDGNLHEYLVVYDLSATSNPSILSPLAPAVFPLQPTLVLGGDSTGRFGCGNSGGQYLAASAGFVYVINTAWECTNSSYQPEIDIYNTKGLSGSHTDVPPVAVIPLSSSFPSALAIGPSGTSIGGQAVARRALIHHANRSLGLGQLDLRHRLVMSHGKVLPYRPRNVDRR